MLKRRLRHLLLCAGVLTLAGCLAQSPKLGEEKVVERSGKKGGWVDAREDSFKKKNGIFYRGMVKGVQDLTLGRRQAEADARKKIVESILLLIQTEYRDSAIGSNLSPLDVGKHVEDAVAWSSGRLNLSGVQTVESYWEKVSTVTYGGVEYSYNCYALVRIEEGDYARARVEAMNKIAEQARAESNRAAEEAAAGLKSRLEDEEQARP